MMIAATIASAMQMMIKYNLFKFFIPQSCLIAILYNKPYALESIRYAKKLVFFHCYNVAMKKKNYVTIT